MNQKFSLQPFPSDQSLSGYQITGDITRKRNHLNISYILVGNLTAIAIPAPSDTPTRKHELWMDTCFEFFLGVKNSARYWEFNLSPTRDWNVYRFNGYRQGMQLETAVTTLPFKVQGLSDSLAIALEINLDPIVPIKQALEVAITTVIKHKDGKVTYWTLDKKKIVRE
ncbi:MAG: DOMON-like domain-containing protein [Goleter apudmare HA4340-LM2]|jgi:hypothetical protein|nr:DOMON-like domain-containing protein [Goleter apudmare HA4340-LM2]